MEKVDIILWIIGAGFAINFGLMQFMWNGLSFKIDKLDEKLTDVDRRLCRLEGAFASKDCCMIKDDKHSRKVE